MLIPKNFSLFKKTNAFTLSELVVVLLLTVVVVGLAFSTLRFVHQYVNEIRVNYSQQARFKQLETALWIDFNRFPESNWSVEDKKLILSSALASVNYQFTKSYVLRETDTIKLAVNPVLFYHGQETEKTLVDAIELRLRESEIKSTAFISKTTDAKTHSTIWDFD